MKTAAAPDNNSVGPGARAWVALSAVFAILWLILTKGEIGSWVVGIIAVPIATWCALSVSVSSNKNTGQSVSVMAVFRFIPYFFWQSLRGGVTCALLAIHPNKRAQTGFIQYKTRLPAGNARLFFVHLISLLPGTVSARWQEDQILIHALDITLDNKAAITDCEREIARLFGLPYEKALETNRQTIDEGH